jgi:Fimbrial assembly protein (PilN)
MDYRANAIDLVGKALNPNAVANFLENLKRVPAFQEPKVGSIDACSGPTGGSLYCFRLSFVFASLDKMQTETPSPATSTPSTGAPKAEGPSQERGTTSPGGSTAAGM